MIITHNMQIEGHELVALSFNPDASGTPIILIHGITASVGTWITDGESLFAQYGPVYALSLPGHYPAVLPSDFQQDDLTAEMIARVLTAAIRELIGEQTAVLIGHSTGAFAVLAIAAHAPEITHSVICIAGFAQGRWIGPLGIAQRVVPHGAIGKIVFKAAYLSNRRPRWWFKASLRIYAADPSAIFAFPFIDAIIDNSRPYYKHLDLDAMAHYFIIMPDIDIETWLPRISAPTLILVGDSDPIVPSAQSDLIAAHVPHAQLNVLKGVGHVPMFERYDDYTRMMDEWLREPSVPI